MQTQFHLAFQVHDLSEARAFYGGMLGCLEGRSTDTWVDFDFFGHQISLHLGQPFPVTNTGKVGNHMVPMPHFGLIMHLKTWRMLADRLVEKGINFIIPPGMRFVGEPGEQATMFFYDPSGNPIEIKGFANFDGIYTK